MYFSPPENTDDLKEKIVNEGNLLKGKQDLVKRVIVGMRRRMQVCVEEMEDMSKEINLHIRNNYYCVSNVTKTLLFVFKIFVYNNGIEI